MTGLEALLAIVGFSVTVLVVVGMVLLTPRGEVDLRAGARDPQGADLSRADVTLTSESAEGDALAGHPAQRR
jgi:hypothetical protein